MHYHPTIDLLFLLLNILYYFSFETRRNIILPAKSKNPLTENSARGRYCFIASYSSQKLALSDLSEDQIIPTRWLRGAWK